MSKLEKDIVDSLNTCKTDCELYSSVKEVLRQHKTLKQKKYRYDFDNALLNGNANRLEKGLNTFRSKMMISYNLTVKGLTQKAIYEKMRLYDVNGFNPKKEDKKLTKAICKLLFIDRSVLVVKR